jgi:Flp pilus assembly protein TadG
MWPVIVRALYLFGGARDGNVAMMFGLLVIPLMMAGGVAVDFARAAHARSAVQEAADEALLRAARFKTMNPKSSDADLVELARKIVAATVAKLNVSIENFEVLYDPATEEFRLSISGKVPTTLLAAVGTKTLGIDTVSAVKLGKPPYMEVALALDNTGSMNDNDKIGHLKTAAQGMVNSLFAMKSAGLKVGLVPFAQYVNVDPANSGQSWVAPDDASWSGCVGSRNYPSNIEDADYAFKPVPGLSAVSCPNSVFPLSDEKSAIIAAIEGMVAQGHTYIPAGLMWGWSVLSPQAPFTEGLSYSEVENRSGIKALVVLTDGQNTRAPDYPTHESTNASDANELMKALCSNIKADGIVVYSIAFDVSDSTIRSLLEDCATTPKHYFAAEDASALDEAFESIALSLRNISLSR